MNHVTDLVTKKLSALLVSFDRLVVLGVQDRHLDTPGSTGSCINLQPVTRENQRPRESLATGIGPGMERDKPIGSQRGPPQVGGWLVIMLLNIDREFILGRLEHTPGRHLTMLGPVSHVTTRRNKRLFQQREVDSVPTVHQRTFAHPHR